MDNLKDNLIPDAVELLMENFMVQRKNNPDVFRELIRNEKAIRIFMIKNFGYQLKLDSETAKLEKKPYFARPWMGIETFTNELDYVFLMATLALLEKRIVDEEFTISDLIIEISIFLTGIYETEWKVKHQRESLIRALVYAQDMELIKVMDGNISDFVNSEAGDVLYVVTPLIRYMFRNFSKSLASFESEEEILHDGVNQENVRHSLFRKLYFEAVVFMSELSEEEIKFIEEEENYEDVKKTIEQYTNFELERNYQSIYFVQKERKRTLKQHPSFKHLSYLVCQISNTLLKEAEKELSIELLVLKNSKFEDILKKAWTEYSLGWSKANREMPFYKLKKKVIDYAVEWKLAQYDEDTMELTIYPAFVRTVGEYDRDLREYIDEFNFKEGRGI
ncbi:TIGR02678 family protein [Psychrobacillus sp. NPDC058041]|uniref:TIGR02678 family protein n=1 Tax=Psychrobacillus sp. NPDC058041 TaxID=3346310 RepID=UPI0036D7AFFD